MTDMLHDGSRQLQDHFGTRQKADSLVERRVHGAISPEDQTFMERMSMFFLATVDENGHVNCSYKAGEPGFVRVVDEGTIAFPNYDGNGMYLSMGNVVQTGEVGLLFVDFENQRRMRLNGTATIDLADPLMTAYPDAQFVVRVQTREIFPNCARRVPKLQPAR